MLKLTRLLPQFLSALLNNGRQGGWDAAAELFRQVKSNLERHLSLDVTSMDVRIQAYANFEGLQRRCTSRGWMKQDADLVNFTQGLTSAHPLFDFIDVGPGKELTDHKLKGVCYTHCWQLMF